MATATADKVSVELEARASGYISDIRRAEADFNSSMVGMTRAAQKMEQQTSLAANTMSSVLRRAIAAIGVASAVREVVKLSDAWTSAANKLAAAGVPMDKVASTQQQLADLARSTRTEFDLTANTYARLTRATKDLGATDVQVARATEIINKAVKAGGSTTQEQASAILQLTQALASGQLQGDELRAIRENSPLLARAIAKEFNTTVGGLKKLGSTGQLEVSRVFKAILDAGNDIDAQFDKTKSTIHEAFVALETEAGRFFSQLNNSTGASAGLTKFISFAADNFDLLAQAVTVTSAVIAAKLGTDLVRSYATAAVANEGFVASLFNGTVGLNSEAEAARTNARMVLLSAQADQDAARISVAATEARILALREESAAYQQNIAQAEAQRAVAAGAATTGRNAAGQFTSRATAVVDRNDATKAVIQNRMQLTRVTNQLTAAEAELAAAQELVTVTGGRVNETSRVMRAAIAETSLVTQAAAGAMGALDAAMGFFGGPIGIAILAIAGALAYFSTQASKAAAASENTQAFLDKMKSAADQARPPVNNLTTATKEHGNAAKETAQHSNTLARSYDGIAAAADNARIAVDYLTASQRAQLLEEGRKNSKDLQSRISGFNPIATNAQEDVDNKLKRLLKSAGVGGTAAYFNGADTVLQDTLAADKAGKTTKAIHQQVLEYNNAVAVLKDYNLQLAKQNAQNDEIEKKIAAPTLKRPTIDTSNLIVQPTTAKKVPKGPKVKSPEELQQLRDELDLENRIQVARAAGADALAEYLTDLKSYQEDIRKFQRDGLTLEEATQKATDQLNALRSARETKQADQRDEGNLKDAEKREADFLEYKNKLRKEGLYLQEAEARVQLDAAKQLGDTEEIKRLERKLELLARINDYTEQGGLTLTEATSRATKDQKTLNHAEEAGKVRDFFKDGVRAALDDDLSSYFENFMKNATSRAFDRAIDYLFNILDSGALSSTGGFLSGLFGAFFGGKHAGGGNMQPGKVYKVGENGPEYVMSDMSARTLPNSAYRAMNQKAQSGPSHVTISIDLTGANGDATIERISRQAAGEGAARALAAAHGTIPTEMQRRASRRLM